MSVELERPFDAPWQARAFAMVVDLHARGAFTWQDWADALATSISVDPSRPYYESWLDALQALMILGDVLTPDSIDAKQREWLDAAARTPHGMPITLDQDPLVPR